MKFLKSIKFPIINLRFFSKTQYSLGIQINKESAKIAYLESTSKGFKLPIVPFQINLPENEEEAGNIIKEELEKRNIKPTKVVSGLSSSSVLFKTLKLPKVSKEELIDAIEYNIKEELNTLKGLASYDFDIIGEEKDFFEILVVIGKMKDIERINTILKYASIKTNIIDADPLALINMALLYQEKTEKEENICIVHFEEKESYLTFYHKNVIIQSLNFSKENYEQLSPDDKEIAVENLINEINYFFLTIHEPENIYLSGYAFKFPEIKEYMQLKFGRRFNLEYLDPVEILNIDYNGSTPLGIYNVPLGLAYRGFLE
ncbi:type IV pilus biogenesis protein PilM [Hydrogenothermus marinus]|uniref:Type IV pilus assembly protein PilM n=1 Tax=Hydrogenothermus marinus TaxID=133270 RepID=A0A3M0BHQ8_9AQUI|nr:pilus assembly protein PilM [Hydrogenothermus marinus]RMA96106.1 type IV pilus assembly protein PilM [Hydrogenothermus marinus]